MFDFLGRLHPLIVHLPSALLFVACAWAGVSFFTKKTTDRPTVSRLVLIGLISAIVSVFTGLLLSNQGTYDQKALALHKWTAIATTMVSAIVYLLLKRDYPYNIKALGFVILFSMIMTTGHLGGSLTHGSHYLWEKAPVALQKVFGYRSDQLSTAIMLPRDSPQLYKHLIQPLLQQHCVSCHKSLNKNGGLDLTSMDGILSGGTKGSVLTPGNPAESELFRRISLAPGDLRYMPPDGPALSYDEIKIIEWWIQTGALTDKTLDQFKLPADIAVILENNYGWVKEVYNPLAHLKITPVDERVIESVRKAGFVVKNIAANTAALEVMAAKSSQVFSKEKLEALHPVKDHIVWLNLSDCGINDEALQAVSDMPNLTKLRLDRNPITDKGLFFLNSLNNLQHITLHSTNVAKEGVSHLLAKLPKLQTIYLGSTNLTPEQITLLQTTHNQVKISGNALAFEEVKGKN